MISKRRLRILYLAVFMFSSIAVVSLILYALRQNINLFYTPNELFSAIKLPQSQIRVGGMVRENSLSYKEGLNVHFIVTDFKQDLQVQYTGILPDLFKEGQGVVALGKLNSANVFVADQILAKHDEKYMP